METIIEDLDMDEHTQELLSELKDRINALAVKTENMSARLGYVEEAIKEIRTCFVTSKEFWPVRAIAYFLVGTMGLAVVGAIVKLVILK